MGNVSKAFVSEVCDGDFQQKHHINDVVNITAAPGDAAILRALRGQMVKNGTHVVTRTNSIYFRQSNTSDRTLASKYTIE